MNKKRLTDKQKRFVFERAEGCCEYCCSQSLFAIQPFCIEHIRPRSRGGETKLDNLALSCQGCNNHKYTKMDATDPLTGRIAPLFHPRQDKWIDHFAWNEDCSLIIGQTRSGRATVEALRLNRIGLVNLRKALFETGKHPPEIYRG